ncbi:MAG: hypothetical protein JXB34_00380 [Bacteroidales bacterium]|nr:hypothetical protein [Bacteroidales bacterium]
MQVKGAALKTTRDFVKTKFPADYKRWIDNLPDSTKKYYESLIDVGGWFPMKESYLVPINKVAEMFYAGNYKKCGDEMGQYSAEVALKGFYKVFLLIATPNYLVQRATKIILTFYTPSEVEAVEIGPKSAGMKIKVFPEISEALEYRMAGWCKKALELSNCTNINYVISKSLAKGDSTTEITYTWQ